MKGKTRESLPNARDIGVMLLLVLSVSPLLKTQTFNAIHTFMEGTHAATLAGLTLDRAGNLSGSNATGGWHDNVTVYRLKSFGDNYANDIYPDNRITLDGSGHHYGATFQGGLSGYNGPGMIYELVRSGDQWSQRRPHPFTRGDDGSGPLRGLTFDLTGGPYGTTTFTGQGNAGPAFQWVGSGSAWSLIGLWNFIGVLESHTLGAAASLNVDQVGNRDDITGDGGAYGYGPVFDLSTSNGIWTYHGGQDSTNGADSVAPRSDVVRINASNSSALGVG